MAAADLKEAWGGRLPTWEEFKRASKDGRVQANRTIALEAGYFRPVPTLFRIFFGIVVLWLGFLIVPIAIVSIFAVGLAWWWTVIAIVAAVYLVKVARDGLVEGMKMGAERDEGFYQMLVSSGAFLFKP